MSITRCHTCGRPVTEWGGAPTEHSEGDGENTEVTCPQCLAGDVVDVEVAAAGWTEHLAAEIEARDDVPEADPTDGGLEQRVRAELDLDPLTAATLIVAEEDKRLSDSEGPPR